MFRFLRLIFPLLIFLLLWRIVRSVFAAFRVATSSQSGSDRPRSVPTGGELKKDPVCGTYVSTATNLTRNIEGNVVYFCSKECRDKYVPT